MYQANENEKLNHKLHRNVNLDYLHTLISNLNMQSSIWVLYLAYLGMNLMQIGLLEGIYHATSIVFEIPSGAMADLLGRRKSMIVSRVLLALSCVIMLFGRHFGWFAFSFILQSVGNSFNSGSEEALVYDSMKCLGREQEYMQVNGRLNVIIEVAQAVATVVGGILAEYSYFWCYSACTVVAVLALLPILLMTEPPIHSEEEAEGKKSPIQTLTLHFRTSMEILKSDRRIFNVVAYYAAVFAAQTLMFYYSQQYFADMGLNKIEISLIMLAAGIVSCGGALLGPVIFNRIGIRLSKMGAIVIAVCIACYVSERLAVVIPVFLIANFFNSALYPVQSDSLNRLVPSKQQATLLSVNSMFFSLSMILSFPLVGALADRLGLPVVFAGLGVLLAAAWATTLKIRLE